MKFLIVSKQDSETGADNYTELKIKNFKSHEKAANHTAKNYSKGTKLYELTEITVNFRKEN